MPGSSLAGAGRAIGLPCGTMRDTEVTAVEMTGNPVLDLFRIPDEHRALPAAVR